MLAVADFVLLLLPSTTETRGFMNQSRLARMQPTAHLLNFGRGDLVVDQELPWRSSATEIVDLADDVVASSFLRDYRPALGQ